MQIKPFRAIVFSTFLFAAVSACFADEMVGIWVGRLSVRDRTSIMSLTIAKKGEKLSGTLSAGEERTPLQDCKVKDRELTCSADPGASDVTRMLIRGVVDGDTLKVTLFVTRKDNGEDVKLGEGEFLRKE